MIDWNSLRAGQDTQRELTEMVNAMLGDEIAHFVGQTKSLREAVGLAIHEVRFQLQGMGAPSDFLEQYDLQFALVREELADLYATDIEADLRQAFRD